MLHVSAVIGAISMIAVSAVISASSMIAVRTVIHGWLRCAQIRRWFFVEKATLESRFRVE